MPTASTRSWWPFPPRTREVQLDEKWAFVQKKEKNCAEGAAADRGAGDAWDHVALDPESRLVLAVVPGKRTAERSRQLVAEVKRRTGGRTDLLITSDAHAPYATAIEEVYGVEQPQPRRPGPGRPPKPKRVLPAGLCYATVCKAREKGRVVEVVRTLVFGAACLLALLLSRSRVSRTVNTSFVERQNATDRRRNARKHRKTYGFSKRLAVHEAASTFVTYSANFCWPVRTLRQKEGDGPWQQRTPAMAAGLTDHPWTLSELLGYQVPLPAWVAPKRRGRPLKREPSAPMPATQPPARPLAA